MGHSIGIAFGHQTYLLLRRAHLLKSRGTSVESVLLFCEISVVGGKGPPQNDAGMGHLAFAILSSIDYEESV